MKSPTAPRVKTPQQALTTLMDRCAKAELARSDARRLLYRWGVGPEEHPRIIETLVEQRFIDENRFASAYVREKARLSRWGIYKIRTGLKAKQIPDEIIADALTQLEEMDMGQKLEELLRKKMRTVKAKTPYELRGKLLYYGTSQGFDHSEVADLLDQLLQQTEDGF